VSPGPDTDPLNGALGHRDAGRGEQSEHDEREHPHARDTPRRPAPFPCSAQHALKRQQRPLALPPAGIADTSGVHGGEGSQGVFGLGERAQLLEGLADDPRDMHLGDPEPLADVALGEVLGEAQAQYLAVAIA
jgi:hypothetical protein